LDVTIINQTGDTLQNLALELSTYGDLKILEKPAPFTLGPYSKRNVKTSIKVSSSETAMIFGCIAYDIVGGSVAENTIILNDIYLDVIDYLHPDTVDDETFREMWSEFDWENKVNVQTDKTDLREFLDFMVKSTNMKCLNVDMDPDLGFLTANLYAKSVFGENSLANVSIELNSGKIEGFIRIRARSQGVAVSLGEKMARAQKEKQTN